MARGSLVIPAKNEGPWIIENLIELIQESELVSEVLIVVDSKDDLTLSSIERLPEQKVRVNPMINLYGHGPANAIRFGIDNANEAVVVVFMADGCDDPRQVDDLIRLVSRGIYVACASRYASGGQQVGGPRLKGLLSKIAGKSFRFLTGVGTSDATNSFKAYNTEFVRKVGIESRSGFEVGIELVAKAKREGVPIAEIPTIWIDKSSRASNFRVLKWIPQYLKWYLFGIVPNQLHRSNK